MMEPVPIWVVSMVYEWCIEKLEIHTECTTASAHRWAVSFCSPSLQCWSLVSIRLPPASAGQLLWPASVLQGAPWSPRANRRGRKSRPQSEGYPPHTLDDLLLPTPHLATVPWQDRSSSGRRRRAALGLGGAGRGPQAPGGCAKPCRREARRLRYCCIVLHHGEGTVSHPSCQKRTSPPKEPVPNPFSLLLKHSHTSLASLSALAWLQK